MSTVSIEVFRAKLAEFGYDSCAKCLEYIKREHYDKYTEFITHPNKELVLYSITMLKTDTFKITSFELLRGAWEEAQLPLLTPEENRIVRYSIHSAYLGMSGGQIDTILNKLNNLTAWTKVH